MTEHFPTMAFLRVILLVTLFKNVSSVSLVISDPFPEPGQDVTVICEGEFNPLDVIVLGKQTAPEGGFFETISANNILLGKYLSDRFRLTEEDTGSTRIFTLYISDVRSEDSAIYVCIVPEGNGNVASTMEVADAPSRVYFQGYEEGEVISGRHGEVITLSCLVDEVLPEPTVDLLAAGNVVSPPDLTKTVQIDPRCPDENDDCLLHYFYDVTLRTEEFELSRDYDEQTIQCRATSSAEWEPVLSTLNAQITYAPYSDSPDTQNLWLGQTDASLSVEFSFNPQLSSPVSLFAFGQDIPPDTPVFGVTFLINEVSPKQTIASINFDVVMSFHFGGYIFTAENEEGILAFTLNVEETSPVTQPPSTPVPTTRDPDFGRITISASRALPDPGEPLIIRCDLSTQFTTDVQIWKSVTDDPSENAQRVSTNTELGPAYAGTGRHSVAYSESGNIRTFQLFITEVTFEETAYYSCFAVDENDWATTLVEVNEGPEDIYFVGYPKNGSLPAMDEDLVDLDCDITGVAPVPRVRVYVGEAEAQEFDVDVSTNPKCFPPTDDCRIHFNYNAMAFTRSWNLTKFLNNLPILCQALYPPTNVTLASETLWTDISFIPYTLSSNYYDVFVGQVNFSAVFHYKHNPDLTETPYLEAFGQMIYPGNTVFGVTFTQQKLSSQASNFSVNISQVLDFHPGTYRLVVENPIGRNDLPVVLNRVDAPVTNATPPSTSQFPPTTTRNPDIVTIVLNAYPKEGDNVTVRCWQRHNGRAFFLNLRKQTYRDGGDYEQVAINNILFEPYASTGRHELETYWNISYTEIKLTIFNATVQDTAFYHCYSSLDETVDVEKSEVVHTPHRLHWEGFETNGTVSAYFRDPVEVECWARNAAPSPRLMVYIDGSTQFYFRTSSYQIDYCVGESRPDCLLHYAYDALIYSVSPFRLERRYHNKALECVSSGTNQETLRSFLFMNVSTEPYTDTYNYFYEYEGTTDFAMVFDLRYNPDLIYDVTFYSNNFEEYYPPGQWVNNSLFYEEVVSDEQRFIYFNTTQLEDYHFGRYTLQTGNILGNLSLNIYLNSLGPQPNSLVISTLKKASTTEVRKIKVANKSYRRIEEQLFQECHDPVPGCKRMFELPGGVCKCIQYEDLVQDNKIKRIPKLDKSALAKNIKRVMKR